MSAAEKHIMHDCINIALYEEYLTDLKDQLFTLHLTEQQHKVHGRSRLPMTEEPTSNLPLTAHHSREPPNTSPSCFHTSLRQNLLHQI